MQDARIRPAILEVMCSCFARAIGAAASLIRAPPASERVLGTRDRCHRLVEQSSIESASVLRYQLVQMFFLPHLQRVALIVHSFVCPGNSRNFSMPYFRVCFLCLLYMATV